MTITLDRSTASGILVKCSDCSYWHAFAWTESEAWASAKRHESAAHGMISRRTQDASNRADYRARHAD